MAKTGRLERDLYHQTFCSSVLCLFNYVITSPRVERTHQLHVLVMVFSGPVLQEEQYLLWTYYAPCTKLETNVYYGMGNKEGLFYMRPGFQDLVDLNQLIRM